MAFRTSGYKRAWAKAHDASVVLVDRTWRKAVITHLANRWSDWDPTDTEIEDIYETLDGCAVGEMKKIFLSAKQASYAKYPSLHHLAAALRGELQQQHHQRMGKACIWTDPLDDPKAKAYYDSEASEIQDDLSRLSDEQIAEIRKKMGSIAIKLTPDKVHGLTWAWAERLGYFA